MRYPFYEPLFLQAVHRVGHAGRVDLEAGADLVEWDRAVPGEQQQHEDFIAGERQPERSEHGIDPAEEQLLCPDHRSDPGHTITGLLPAVRTPLATGLGDRVGSMGTSSPNGQKTALPGD